jgi:hypothetical protein
MFSLRSDQLTVALGQHQGAKLAITRKYSLTIGCVEKMRAAQLQMPA